MLIHLRVKNFQCRFCSMKFVQKVNLETHVKQVHPPPNDPVLKNRFICLKCPSSFKRIGLLKIHRARIHGEMVMLDQWMKPAATATSAPAESSSEERKVKAKPNEVTEQESEIVHKVVASRRTEHMKGCTKERKHVCSVCQAAFLKSAHLAQHTTSHLGIRSYRCEICDKTFSTKQSLNVHANLHTQNARPFSCETCEETFNRLGTLKRHTAAQHEKQKHAFHCPYCTGKTFRWLHNCRTHIKAFHSDSGPVLLEPLKESLANTSEEDVIEGQGE
uniref:C2H2-type domain-containing protein n=1 Tax=Anopheles dirus TaxID=7168 RepID=A0A182NXF3_9DIPT